MHIGWFIGLSIVSTIFLVFYVLASRKVYVNRFKKNYDFRNYFPYEFNYESPFSINIIGNIALIMACSASIGLFAMSSVKIFNNGFIIYGLISGIVYSLLIVAINFIPLKTIKLHMVFLAFFILASFATPAAFGLAAFNVYQNTKETYPLVLFIVAAVIALFYFGVGMNPKLTLNIKAEVETDDKGNEVYIRPKFIVIALSEWFAIFGLPVSQILMILVMELLLR